MTMNNNFKWLINDIDSTIVLKVTSNIYNKVDYGTYCVQSILEADWDDINIKIANIDDLTNLLTSGIIRFVNIVDDNDILDIPFKNLYKLYMNANVLGEEQIGSLISFKELEIFSVINGKIRENLFIYAAVIDKISDDLRKIMKIAFEFNNYDMQQRFDALSEITFIDHRRLIDDTKNKSYR